MTRPRRKWDYSEGKAEAFSQEPIALYRVHEVAQKGRKPPIYQVSVLTEVGHLDFPNGVRTSFSTMAAAQRFCEDHVDRWRAKIRESRERQADDADACSDDMAEA
jgi:hypothetical protein